MRIKHLQQALREAGRIRIGYSTPSAKGNKIPHKLNRFRFTAPDAATIEAVAAVYGGTPEPWPEGGRDRYQVTSNVDALNAVLPVGLNALWQCFEQYRGGFLALRCDGERYMTPDPRGRLADEGPCSCDPNDRACSMTTALSIILRDLPGISTWRVVTHSFYAAGELTAAVDMIESAMAAGMSVPVRLFLTERTRRALVDGKPVTKHFPVLALDLAMPVAALAGNGSAGPALPAGGPAEISGWSPVDQEALPPAPLSTVADQLAEVDRPRKARANAAPPVRSTGRKPRTEAEAQAAALDCSACGQPYGTAKLVRNPEPGGSRFIHASHLEEGEPEADQPPPEADERRDAGGTADQGAPPVDPARVAAPHVRMMSHAQHRKVMALSADVWPAEGRSGRDMDDMRRERLLFLCAALGQPGITSRKEITAETAGPLIDALEALNNGWLKLTDRGLEDVTGTVVPAAPA